MKKDLVQILNPRTKRYVVVDREKGQVVSHKRSKGPYKNIPIRKVEDVSRREQYS